MSTCLTFDEILETGKPQLKSLEDVGDAFQNGEEQAACEAFSREVRQLESFITQIYIQAVAITRKTDDLHEIAEIWKHIGLFCTPVLAALSRLKGKYPYCGTPQLYDLTLDYKLASEKRYRNILEEIECQSQTLPKGLFPTLT